MSCWRLLMTAVMLGLAACAAPAAAPPTASAPTALPWADAGLAGKALFTEQMGGARLLDLTTGQITEVFTPPAEQAWVNAATLSPDGRWLALAYAPPPPAGQIQFGYTEIHLISMGANRALTPLLTRQVPQESFFNPQWSPDGRYLYYARLAPYVVPNTDPPQYSYQYTVERVAYPAGTRETLVENAYWPRLSADGQRLAYVGVDPRTFATWLMVSQADGSQPVTLTVPANFQAVDAPVFTPDNQYVLFSALGQAMPAPASRWERWLGVGVASAHNAPSDWWRIPVTGGTPERLTQIYRLNLYGAFDPAGAPRLLFGSDQGLAVMQADGSGLTRVLTTDREIGTLEWLK